MESRPLPETGFKGRTLRPTVDAVGSGVQAQPYRSPRPVHRRAAAEPVHLHPRSPRTDLAQNAPRASSVPLSHIGQPRGQNEARGIPRIPRNSTFPSTPSASHEPRVQDPVGENAGLTVARKTLRTSLETWTSPSLTTTLSRTRDRILVATAEHDEEAETFVEKLHFHIIFSFAWITHARRFEPPHEAEKSQDIRTVCAKEHGQLRSPPLRWRWGGRMRGHTT
eukprot:gene8708-biopygen21169